jgi:hypothetical protein
MTGDLSKIFSPERLQNLGFGRLPDAKNEIKIKTPQKVQDLSRKQQQHQNAL